MNLVWRICRDCYPTCVKLQCRDVNCPLACITCDDPHEDSYHIIFHCKTSIDVWNATNVWHLISPSLNHFDNASDIIFSLLQQLLATQIEIIITIMWSIWKARNFKLCGNMCQTRALQSWREPSTYKKVGGLVITSKVPQVRFTHRFHYKSHQHHDQNSNNRDKDIRWRKPRGG